jgi:hypothetical protein
MQLLQSRMVESISGRKTLYILSEERPAIDHKLEFLTNFQ